VRGKNAARWPEPFDAGYFRKYYESRRSRVYGREQIAPLAQGVTGFIGWFGGDLESVLDVGAGVGLWRDWFREHLPNGPLPVARRERVRLREIRPRAPGHHPVARPREVRPRGVPGRHAYFDDEGCARATANMAAMCRGFLYLEAITSRDLREVVDRSKTDVTVHAPLRHVLPPVLREHFEPLGCGLHHVRGGDKLFLRPRARLNLFPQLRQEPRLLEELRDERRPPRLRPGAQTLAGVAVEVLEERHVVGELRIGLERVARAAVTPGACRPHWPERGLMRRRRELRGRPPRLGASCRSRSALDSSASPRGSARGAGGLDDQVVTGIQMAHASSSSRRRGPSGSSAGS